MKKILVIAAIFMASCTDASCAGLAAYGDSAEVKCYSGAKLIYDGSSTGKIKSAQSSDGYIFKDAATGELVEVSGNCVLKY